MTSLQSPIVPETPKPILYENDVVFAVVDHLRTDGWSIESFATVDQRGADIVAHRNGITLWIEAKGGGSSKSHSNRYGLPFTLGQVQINVGMALLTSMRMIDDSPNKAAIALPRTAHYLQEVNRIRHAIIRLGIIVFWVDHTGTVTQDG